MILFEYTKVSGWEAALRGMRNPMNSWDRSDTDFNGEAMVQGMGINDHTLAQKLADAGQVHGKYLRMINVTVDITAPMYWWQEFDTYKVGTVRNSCSKMHKIHSKTFTTADFAHDGIDEVAYAQEALDAVIAACERLRLDFNATKEKKYWRALIELLPEGYCMRATVQLNYEVLLHMYWSRKDHKLTEWHDFCRMIEGLPYFKEVCLAEEEG